MAVNENYPDFDAESFDSVDSKKKFRVAAKKFMLTYKHHLDKDDLKDFLLGIRKKMHLNHFFAAHEIGDTSHSYKHTHVVIEWEKRWESENPRIFDFPSVVNEYGDVETIHPNIKIIKPMPKFGIRTDEMAWIAAVRYLGKYDPENAHLKEYEQDRWDELTKGVKGFISKVISAPTRLAAYEMASDLRQIHAIDLIYKEKSSEIPKLVDTEFCPPKKWQIDLLDEIKINKKFNRTITWYYDEIGNTGKTYFSNWAIDELGDQVVTLDAFGRNQDAAQIFLGLQEKGKLPRVLILDLSRSFKDRDSIYGTLENILNGRMTSTKYEGGIVRWRSEHVIVFANFLPNVRAASQDRWDIRELRAKDSEIHVERLSYYDVLRQQEVECN